MSLPAGVSPYLLALRHVGVVTEDGAALVSRLQQIFGIADNEIVQVPPPNAGEGAAGSATPDTRFWFFQIGGLPYEVIEPVSAHFRDLLLRDGAGSNRGVNHVCYTVTDLPAAIEAMADAGVRTGHVTPDGMVELPHFRMAYFNPEDTAGLLIEFVEPRE